MSEVLTALAPQPARFDIVVGELDGAARRVAAAAGALSGVCDTLAAGAAAHGALPETSLAAVEERADRLFDAVRHDLALMVSNAATGFDAAVLGTGSVAAERIAGELAPVRQAAEDHAAWLRAAPQRLRGETEALGAAQQAAAAVRSLSVARGIEPTDDGAEVAPLTSPVKRRRRAA